MLEADVELETEVEHGVDELETDVLELTLEVDDGHGVDVVTGIGVVLGAEYVGRDDVVLELIVGYGGAGVLVEQGWLVEGVGAIYPGGSVTTSVAVVEPSSTSIVSVRFGSAVAVTVCVAAITSLTVRVTVWPTTPVACGEEPLPSTLTTDIDGADAASIGRAVASEKIEARAKSLELLRRCIMALARHESLEVMGGGVGWAVGV